MTRPLEGIRVLDFGAFIAVPYATAILAALGADVIKVEPLPPGDPFRRGRGSDDVYFGQYNAGKRSASIDLKTTDGRKVAHALVDSCDVVIHNLRPGKAEKLTLGYENLTASRPRLIYAAVSGFGNVGPLTSRPGYDSVAQSISGLFSLLAPVNVHEAAGLPLSDNTTGAVAAMGVCAALVRRAHTGFGGLVETSLYEVSTMLSTEAMVYRPPAGAGTAGSGSSTHSARSQAFTILCADGRVIVLALGDFEGHWRALTKIASQLESTALVDAEGLDYSARVQTHSVLQDRVQQALGTFDSGRVLTLVQESGIPATIAYTYAESVVRPDGILHELAAAPGLKDMIQIGMSVDGSTPRRRFEVPHVGHHTRELLVEAGFSGEHIRRLEAESVVYCAPSLNDEGGALIATGAKLPSGPRSEAK